MRICVIALPRSGSSTLCRYLADEYTLRNSGEIQRTKTGSIPNINRDNIVFKLIPQHIRAMVLQDFIEDELRSSPKYVRVLKRQQYSSNEVMYNLTVKYNHVLFPHALTMASEIVSKADKCIFLCRKDTTAQILSFAAMLQTGKASKNRNTKQIDLLDSSLFAANNFSFKLNGIPLYRELYRVFGSTSSIIYTEDLPALTGTAPYDKISYSYDRSLIEEIEYKTLFEG